MLLLLSSPKPQSVFFNVQSVFRVIISHGSTSKEMKNFGQLTSSCVRSFHLRFPSLSLYPRFAPHSTTSFGQLFMPFSSQEGLPSSSLDNESIISHDLASEKHMLYQLWWLCSRTKELLTYMSNRTLCYSPMIFSNNLPEQIRTLPTWWSSCLTGQTRPPNYANSTAKKECVTKNLLWPHRCVRNVVWQSSL